MVFFFETPWLVIRAMSKDDDVESGEVRAGFIFWLLWLWLWLFGPAAIFKNRSAGLERIVLSSAVCYIYIYLVGGGGPKASVSSRIALHTSSREMPTLPTLDGRV